MQSEWTISEYHLELFTSYLFSSDINGGDRKYTLDITKLYK